MSVGLPFMRAGTPDLIYWSGSGWYACRVDENEQAQWQRVLRTSNTTLHDSARSLGLGTPQYFAYAPDNYVIIDHTDHVCPKCGDVQDIDDPYYYEDHAVECSNCGYLVREA